MAYIGNKPAELAVDIDNASVTTEKLANDAVTAAKIVDGTIIADDLNNGIITNSKVSASAAIAASKLAISGGSNITLQSDGTFDLDNTVDVTGGYSVSGTAVVDSSRNAFITSLEVRGAGHSTNRLNLSYNSTSGIATVGPNSTGGNTTFALGSSNNGTYSTKLTVKHDGNVNIDSGGLQVGGTTVIDSSRAALNLTRVAINNDNSGDYYAGASDLVIGDDDNNDNGITIVTASNKTGRIHFADGTTGADEYAGFVAYKHADDELVMGAGATGGTDLTVGDGYINVAGNLQIGGSTAIDSSRNYTGPYFASSSSVNSSGDGGLQMYTNHRLGFDESGVRSWNLKATGGSLAVTSGDGNGGFNIAGPEFKMGGTTVLEQDRDLVNIRSFSIVGDATSGGLKNKFAQPGTGGSSYSIMVTNNLNGSLSGGKFAVLDDNVSGNNAAQARFVINSSGKIGIGNPSPASHLTVESTATNTADVLRLVSHNDSGAGTTGVHIDTYHDKPTTQDNTDVPFMLSMSAKDGSGNNHTYGRITQQIDDRTNGAEKGSLRFWSAQSPNLTELVRMGNGAALAIPTTSNNGIYLGDTPGDYSAYGTGVPTIDIRGTSSANRRGGAITFREQDSTLTGAIYSTYGGDGYAGLNFHSKTEAIKFAVGGSSSGPSDDIVTIEGGSNKSRLNVNYLANVYNGGLGGVYAYNGFIGANEISASGSDNDANVRVRVCIDTNTGVWRAGYCWVTASSCGVSGQGPVTAWWLYRFRTYNSSLGGISVADSGGDTSSFSVAFSDDGDPDGDGTSLVIGVRVASTHSTANDETTMGIVLGTREGPPRAAERISG